MSPYVEGSHPVTWRAISAGPYLGQRLRRGLGLEALVLEGSEVSPGGDGLRLGAELRLRIARVLGNTTHGAQLHDETIGSLRYSASYA
jgi:hypothetical protein